MEKEEGSGSAVGSAGTQTPTRVAIGARSDVGQNRANNEDNLVIFDLQQQVALPPGEETRRALVYPGLLLAVADGMGGHSSGQVASALCVETLPLALARVLPENPAAGEIANALRTAVEATNTVVYDRAHANSADKGMGTTLTAAWLFGRDAVIAQVGDSRAYRLRQNDFTQITRDQTVLNSVSEAERDALRNTPFENMLLQAVGAMEFLDVVITTTELTPGDALLLCSDGLYRVLQPPQLEEILRGPGTVQEKVDRLIRLANEGGAPDNVTVVVCRLAEPQE